MAVAREIALRLLDTAARIAELGAAAVTFHDDDLLPDEVRTPPRPTLAELALTYPDGVVPAEDRWFAVDGDEQV